MHMQTSREMAQSATNKKDERGESTKKEPKVKDLPSPNPAESQSEDSYQKQWIVNNNNNNNMEDTFDESSKDYYNKYEADSGFRTFVKTLLRSSSEANISQSKHNKKVEKVKVLSDNKDNIPTKINKPENKQNKSSSNNDLKNKTLASKNNDDIPLSKGRYQDMVKERWGDHRRVDHRLGERSEARVSGHIRHKKPEETPEKQNTSSDLTTPQWRSYATLPGERASVVLRQKHKHLVGQDREEATNSGVFSLPRVSCYHRSTRIWE